MNVKKDKKAVHYSKGMPSAHCGICKHFLASQKRCSLVEGEIKPAYWCELFTREPKAE